MGNLIFQWISIKDTRGYLYHESYA